jgi:ankyrin repeat protein
MISVAAMAQQPEKAPEKFYSAIRENDFTQLKALLGPKGSANVADDRGITPLMYAAEIGSPDAMRLLIDGGADVNAQNAFGSTALMWSVSDPAKVRLLLDHGAQVNGRLETIPRPFACCLMNVAGNRNVEAVKLLLSKGAAVNAVSKTEGLPKFRQARSNSAAGLLC